MFASVGISKFLALLVPFIDFFYELLDCSPFYVSILCYYASVFD